ncbi:MAG: hypothetical protein MRERV_3c104 [Mycoplasmataceae bacterium RV_VA103A]|nr:MAG: hypothetical protein MRERV_3c104 [Mycoplasmataceae bacterium RV_VA103A]
MDRNKNNTGKKETWEVQGKIKYIRNMIDKKGNNYLILHLVGIASIFVFPKKVPPEKWGNLKEKLDYIFIVEEGNNGTNILTDFKLDQTNE